jgi:hypothetical protein
MALSTAISATPTSPKTVSHIVALPKASNTNITTFTSKAKVIFSITVLSSINYITSNLHMSICSCIHCIQTSINCQPTYPTKKDIHI